MYCRTCDGIFIDIDKKHDSRIEKMIINCPYCLSMHTINATKYIKYDYEFKMDIEKRKIAHEFYHRLKNLIRGFENTRTIFVK
jgi:hypothetical protein